MLLYHVSPVLVRWFEVSTRKASGLIFKCFDQEFFVTLIWVVEQTIQII